MSYKGGRARPEGSSQDRRQPPNARPRSSLVFDDGARPDQTRSKRSLQRHESHQRHRELAQQEQALPIEVLPMLRGDPARVDMEPHVNSQRGRRIARSRSATPTLSAPSWPFVAQASRLRRRHLAQSRRGRREEQTSGLVGGLAGAWQAPREVNPGDGGLPRISAGSRQTALRMRSRVRMESINWRGG